MSKVPVFNHSRFEIHQKLDCFKFQIKKKMFATNEKQMVNSITMVGKCTYFDKQVSKIPIDNKVHS